MRQSFETATSVYTVTGIAGKGGNAFVYRAKDGSDKEWAIKVLDPHTATVEKRRRFKNEIAFSTRNTHPNIVTITDYGITRLRGKNSPFYVMRYFPKSLKNVISEEMETSSILPTFLKILGGVEAAHLLGTTHRDIKPANILIDPEVSDVCIADFGIARFSEDQLLTAVDTQPGSRLANFEYAAPEQRRPGAAADHRADIFALGLILHEMFMREVPHGTAVTPIASRFPEFGYLDQLIELMRAQSPQDRPQSVADIREQLAIRGDVFSARQKLSKLHVAVVPETTVDDPLVLDPPAIERYHWDDGRLYFIFQKRVTPTWFATFQRISWGSAPGGKSPAAFAFAGNAISVSVHREEDIKPVIEHVKRWISVANDDYRELVEREHQERENEMRRALEAKRAQEAQRLRMLEAIQRAG